MTEAQKKELKKIQKAVMATAKKIRTKIVKKQKQLKKKEGGLIKIIELGVPNYNTDDWYKWEFTLNYTKKRGKKVYKYKWKDSDSSGLDLNLNDLKGWINKVGTEIFDSGWKIKDIEFDIEFYQHKSVWVLDPYFDPDYYDPSDLTDFRDYSIEEVEYRNFGIWDVKLKSPWKYGNIKIEIEESGWSEV